MGSNQFWFTERCKLYCLVHALLHWGSVDPLQPPPEGDHSVPDAPGGLKQGDIVCLNDDDTDLWHVASMVMNEEDQQWWVRLTRVGVNTKCPHHFKHMPEEVMEFQLGSFEAPSSICKHQRMQGQLPAYFFTLSAAELQWDDFHSHFHAGWAGPGGLNYMKHAPHACPSHEHHDGSCGACSHSFQQRAAALRCVASLG